MGTFAKCQNESQHLAFALDHLMPCGLRVQRPQSRQVQRTQKMHRRLIQREDGIVVCANGGTKVHAMN
jgi:hypothetical protein